MAGGEHLLGGDELVRGEGGLSSPIGIVSQLGMGNAGHLRLLGRLILGFADSSHEGDEAVPNGLLDGIGGGAVEDHGVDDGLYDDALFHEGLNGLVDVIEVSAEAIDPSDEENVSGSEDVEEALSLGSLGQLC